jgi:hypothetical protein
MGLWCIVAPDGSNCVDDILARQLSRTGDADLAGLNFLIFSDILR